MIIYQNYVLPVENLSTSFPRKSETWEFFGL